MVHGKNNCLVVVKKSQSAFFKKLFAAVTGIIVVSIFFLFTDSDKHTVYPDMIVSTNNTGVTSIVTGSVTYYTKVAVGIIRGIDSWVTFAGSAFSYIRQYSNGLQSGHQRFDSEVTEYAVYGIASAGVIFTLAIVVVSRIRHQF